MESSTFERSLDLRLHINLGTLKLIRQLVSFISSFYIERSRDQFQKGGNDSRVHTFATKHKVNTYSECLTDSNVQ